MAVPSALTAPAADAAAFIQAARELAPQMEAVRDEIERERGIPPTLIESMGEAGLSRARCNCLDARRRAAQ